MNNIIALSGLGRAGKDTFCNILRDLLTKEGIESKRVALADELKRDLDPFLSEKFNISAFTTLTPEKELIRDMMVAYGKIKRKQTRGTYWTNLATKQIQELWDKNILPIVTDVRYDFYDQDEVYWAKNKMNGTLVHISRYETHTVTYHDIDDTKTEITNKIFINPPNQDETENDPKVREKADFRVQWQTSFNASVVPEKDPSLVVHVQQFIQWYKQNGKLVTV